MEWQATDSGDTLCVEHGKTFGPLDYCPDCPVGGGQKDAAVERTTDAQADADERLCREVRDEVLRIARDMVNGREEREAVDRVGYSTAAKLFDTALKWHRCAMEERKARGDREFAEWLVAEKRRLLGRGASH